MVRGTGSFNMGTVWWNAQLCKSKNQKDKPFAFESINTVGSYGLLK